MNVDQIIAWEQGDMSAEEERTFFQDLVDSGLAWELQGAYGRRAADLIADGAITDTHHVIPDIDNVRRRTAAYLASAFNDR